MIGIIESKIADIVGEIIDKPVEQITKADYDILSSELYRQKAKIESAEQSKRLAELMATVIAK